jgi:hypothetical protein
MKYDIFEFHRDMTPAQKTWRVVFLAIIVGTLVLDLTFWRA